MTTWFTFRNAPKTLPFGYTDKGSFSTGVTARIPFYLTDPGPHHYWQAPLMAVDFETTNLDKGDARNPNNQIVMCCVWRPEMFGGKVTEIDPATYEWPTRCILLAHNAKFELGWFRRLGVDVTDWLVWDTMLGEYVLAGNRPWALDLGSVCARYGLPGKHAIVAKLMSRGVCPSEIPRHWLLQRCIRDVESVVAIQRAQSQSLAAARLEPVFFTRCIVTPVLAEIEFQGMCLDEKLVEKEYDKESANKARLEKSLAEVTGGINLRSGKQLADVLYNKLGFQEPTDKRGNPARTQAGNPKTDKATIARLTGKSPEQKAFLQAFGALRDSDSALAKSLEFFRGVCRDYNGAFFGNFNQAVTRTHRLSSSGKRLLVDGRLRGVQFQNLPRNYKGLFWAGDEDYVMVEADGVGLEFRVAADLGDDPQALADIESGQDVHRFTASIIYNVPEDAVTPKQRTKAKAHTFKPLFSEGKTGSPREQKYYAAFKEKYAAITAEQTRWVAAAMRYGQIRLPSGLITYHTVRVTRSGFVEGSNQVRNIPIQSFATADIIPVSMVYTFWTMRAEGIDGALVNTVHDSIVGYVRKNQVDKFHKIVLDCFLDKTYRYIERVYGRIMKVPLGVGFKAGSHWGDGDEIKTTRGYKRQ